MAPVIALLLAASAAAAQPKTIRVLAFNAAGIPLVHPRLGARMKEAGEILAKDRYDIAGMQELWRDGDSARLAAASGLSNSARVPRSIAFGSGLTVLSRWPVVLQAQRPFSSLRPSLRHPQEGEVLAGKGWLLARTATPWGELDVWSAHTLADYPEAQYHFLRLTELFELSEAIRERSAGRPFVVLADLNSGRGDAEFDAFMDLLGLVDLCEEKGKDVCPEPERTRRIDHILVPGPLAARGRRVLEAPAYSDHSGFAADLPRAVMSLRAKPDAWRRAKALEAVMDATTAAIERLDARKRQGGWIPLYGAFLAARYDRQIERLSAIRERAQTAR